MAPAIRRRQPDPFAVVSFTNADPAFALCDNGKDLVVVNRHYQLWFPDPLHGGRRGGGPMVAAAPLIAGTPDHRRAWVRQGRGRRWKAEAKNTLKTVAALFAQFQARISAEERLRHLADHDDLTGLRNRRALLAHLADRLAPRQAGPVAELYLISTV